MFAGVSIPWKKSKTLLNGKKEKTVTKAVRSLDCQHDWQFVQDRKGKFRESPGMVEINALAFCPLCKTSQVFSGQDWEAIQKIQEIQKKYKR